MKRFVLGLLAACAFAGVAAPPASAAVITFSLDVEFSGATPPAGPAPWVTATFADLVGGGVRLTVSTSGLTGVEFLTDFYFNFNPALNAALFLPSTPGTGSQTDWNSITAGNNCCQADGDGQFDFNIDFPPPPGTLANLFTAGETFIVEWGAATGLTTADFNFVSVDGPVGKNGFHAAAHIQGIGPDGALSGWIGDSGRFPPTGIPEPHTLALLGLALAGFGFARRKLH